MPVLLLFRHAVKLHIIDVDFFLLPKKYNRLSPNLVYCFLCQISPYLLCYPVGIYVYGPKTAVPRHILQKIIGIRGAKKYALSLEGFNVVSVCGSVGILALCGKLLDRFYLVPLQCRQLRHFDNPETLYLLVGLLPLHRSQRIRKPFLSQLFQKGAFSTPLRANQNQHVIILYARHKYSRHRGNKCLLRYLSGVSAVLCPLIFNQQRFQSGYTIPNTTFASNIYRVQQIIDLAVEDGRKVAFSGRSMVNNTAMAQELGYMHIPEGTLISVDELNQYPPEQVVLVTTGSQGEPLSALSRMASCSHRQVRVGPGDFIIISANPIPGNEKSVTKIVNGLLLLGAEVIYESMYDVHVSGHACQEEQKLMLTLTKPKYFLPVHGEYKQLKKHALTAASLGIPTSNILIAENGSNVILSQDEMKLGEPVTAGAVMVDGLGVGDVGNVVLRDRKHLSEDGLVIIVATVDSKTGKVLAGPDLVSRGFVYVRENESLMDGAQSIVENALERCVDEHVRDWNSVKTRVREALSSYIYRRTKRSPMILPILMEV